VTEMVTGVDLIKTQIRVAAGEPLRFDQDAVPSRGVSIECRINAEDPRKNFRPCPGRIDRLIVPGGFGVRFDSHAHSGYQVPSQYDSMIGKLIVHQRTRSEAIACMQRALSELRVDGIQTTVPLHREILDHSSFVEGCIDTTFVERTFGGD
ncbi:MAG: acetyl-CoA carboxylase biotin carboxylase subunit, partial [Pirellulales bacterium]